MTLRKIEAMHSMFGVLPDKRCEDCANLIQGDYHDRHYRKCLIYGATHSEATDWRKKYVACGMYNRDWRGTPMKEPDDKIFYAHICERIPETCVFQDTFAQAVEFAKSDQPAYRPWYIVKCVMKYEICGVIGKNGRLRRMRSEAN